MIKLNNQSSQNKGTTKEIKDFGLYGFGGPAGGRFTGQGECIGEVLLQEPEKKISKHDNINNGDDIRGDRKGDSTRHYSFF